MAQPVEGLALPLDTREVIRLPAEPAKPQPDKPKRNLSTKQAAERLGVCKLTIHRMIKAGKLRAFHLSKRSVRIPEAEIERLENGGD
jgi:excisionase family DNA binding protein